MLISRFHSKVLKTAKLTSLIHSVHGQVPVDDGESLATAVCCDDRMHNWAEPQMLYQFPFVNLYGEMNANGTTTFYDSVCGIPLFEAPKGRSLEEFQADTDEHGWPSFREVRLR